MCVYIYHRTRVRPACACGVSEAGGPVMGLSKLPRIRRVVFLKCASALRVPAIAPARFRADKRPGPPPREMAGNSAPKTQFLPLRFSGRAGNLGPRHDLSAGAIPSRKQAVSMSLRAFSKVQIIFVCSVGQIISKRRAGYTHGFALWLYVYALIRG